MTTPEQVNLIALKFAEVRAAIGEHVFPQGAKPSISDMWAMATSLVISEISNGNLPN